MARNVRVNYSPEAGSKRSWVIDFDNPPWDVMKQACKQAGCGWSTLQVRLADTDPEAWQAMIWVLRKRDEPRLEFDSVSFPSGLLAELDLEDVESEPAVVPDEAPVSNADGESGEA